MPLISVISVTNRPHVVMMSLIYGTMSLREEFDPTTRTRPTMTQPKQPPPGVETTPQGPVVWLQEAAARLDRDPRTLIRAITAGELRGGAMPRPERLRWYVYPDELPAAPTVTAGPPPQAPSKIFAPRSFR